MVQRCILTTSELYLTEGAHHFHCLYMPSRYLGCAPGRSYKKQRNSCKFTGKYNTFSHNTMHPSRNDLVKITMMWWYSSLAIQTQSVHTSNAQHSLTANYGCVVRQLGFNMICLHSWNAAEVGYNHIISLQLITWVSEQQCGANAEWYTIVPQLFECEMHQTLFDFPFTSEFQPCQYTTERELWDYPGELWANGSPSECQYRDDIFYMSLRNPLAGPIRYGG